MKLRFRREAEVPTRVVETVEAVEIPLITETKRRLSKGEVSEAILQAYSTAVQDLGRGLGKPFPASWTHQEILERIPAEHKAVKEFLVELHGMYQPLRYGTARSADATRLLPILQSLYSHRVLWHLYVQPKNLPDAPRSSPSLAGRSSASPEA